MISDNDRLLFGTRTSWLAACVRAALIEGALAAFFVFSFFVPAGADNPLWFYLAGLLHLPSSLLFPLLDRPTLQLLPGVVVDGFLFACCVVAFLQFSLLVVLFRKPWSRDAPDTVV